MEAEVKRENKTKSKHPLAFYHHPIKPIIPPPDRPLHRAAPHRSVVTMDAADSGTDWSTIAYLTIFKHVGHTSRLLSLDELID
jgi:hypothetical protein